MFCPSCGAESDEAWRSCRRCGGTSAVSANAAAPATPLVQPVPRDWLIPLINAAAAVSLAGIGIGGLAIILGYLERLLRLEVPLQAALLVTLGGLLGFFMVIGFISQQLFRSLHKPQAASQPEPRFAEAEPQAARLNSAEAAAASVTEHTTRHLEGELCKR